VVSSRSHPDSQFGSPHASIWLFLFLVAVYLLSYSGAFHAIDEVSVAAMTESLVKHGRVSTDQIWWSQEWAPSQGRIGPDGHLYSKKGIGSALLGAPFYWLALQLPALGAVRAMMLANALVTALTGWLVYRCILRLGYRPLVAVLTALGFGLGTMAWPYAKYFFSEPLTALDPRLLGMAGSGPDWQSGLCSLCRQWLGPCLVGQGREFGDVAAFPRSRLVDCHPLVEGCPYDADEAVGGTVSGFSAAFGGRWAGPDRLQCRSHWTGVRPRLCCR
jgi:hypothetical protein